MSDQLADLLAPGERVLYHAKRSWRPNEWLTETLIYATSLGTVAAAGLLSLDPPGLLSVATVLAGPLAHWLWVIWRDWSREALVTERRLLHRSGWFTTTVTEVDVATVTEIRTIREKFRLIRSDGKRLEFGHPQEAWGLAGALACAAGIALPRLPSRKELAVDWLYLTTGLTAWLAATLPVLNWVYGSLSVPLLSAVGLAILGGLFVVAQVMLLPSLTIAGLITAALIRPFFSQPEIEAWIDHSHAFWPDPATQDEIEWHGRLCRRFAALLYGRRPRGSDNRPQPDDRPPRPGPDGP